LRADMILYELITGCGGKNSLVLQQLQRNHDQEHGQSINAISEIG
jgi:hypothetical protein